MNTHSTDNCCIIDEYREYKLGALLMNTHSKEYVYNKTMDVLLMNTHSKDNWCIVYEYTDLRQLYYW